MHYLGRIFEKGISSNVFNCSTRLQIFKPESFIALRYTLASVAMEKPSQKELYFLIMTLERNDMKASDIHRIIVKAHGNIISLRRVQDVSKEFKTGERRTTTRAEGSGRPVSSCTDENADTIAEIVEADPHVSCNHLQDLTSIPQSSVHRILTGKLNKKSVCARWVPHVLTEEQKQNRVNECNELLIHFGQDSSQRLTVITDEKWIFCRHLQSTHNMRSWIDAGGDRPQVGRRTISDRKFMWLMAANFSGNFYFEIMHDGGSVNAQRYLQFLQSALRSFSHDLNCKIENLSVMHDNARPHIALIVKQWLQQVGVATVKQPAYSPDVNLQDRYLFRNFETFRRGRPSTNAAEIQNLVTQYLQATSASSLRKEFVNFKEDLSSIIEAGGNYL